MFFRHGVFFRHGLHGIISLEYMKNLIINILEAAAFLALGLGVSILS